MGCRNECAVPQTLFPPHRQKIPGTGRSTTTALRRICTRSQIFLLQSIQFSHHMLAPRLLPCAWLFIADRPLIALARSSLSWLRDSVQTITICSSRSDFFLQPVMAVVSMFRPKPVQLFPNLLRKRYCQRLSKVDMILWEAWDQLNNPARSIPLAARPRRPSLNVVEQLNGNKNLKYCISAISGAIPLTSRRLAKTFPGLS